jgi:hypothetical protein
MTTKRIFALAATCALFLLAGCGGGDGVKLGEFPALVKTEGDAPFKLTAPSSKSPAAFTYSSSDPRVATIVDDMVTVHVAGTTTITAQQGRTGSYNPTSTSTVLTVRERSCAAPSVRGNGLCVVPATTAAYISRGALTWMPTAVALAWAEADAFCKGVTIQGKTGWRLPDPFELRDLALSGQLSGQGWAMGDAWSATAGTTDKTHLAVDLTTGANTTFVNENKSYVTCVRKADA